MKKTSLALFATMVLLTGCDWFASKGGDSGGGGGKQEDPAKPGPNPEPGNQLWIEREALPEIHREFYQAYLTADLKGREWDRVAGWKLYVAVAKKVRGLDGLVENQTGARVFARLFETLTEADGSVVAEIDPTYVIKELKKELKRKR